MTLRNVKKKLARGWAVVKNRSPQEIKDGVSLRF